MTVLDRSELRVKEKVFLKICNSSKSWFDVYARELHLVVAVLPG